MTSPSKILIVDDTAAIHTMIAALLRDENYQLEHAYTGIEALRMAEAIVPDLVLLDIMMPDIDGFEVCRQLRSKPQLADVPIILLTALADRASRLRGLGVGADDFISKPFDQAELRVRVRTITRLNRYRRLLEERARFERLIALAPDGVLVVSGDGMIRLANPSMAQLLKEDDEAALSGRRFAEFVASPERDAWSTFFGQVKRSGSGLSRESVLRQHDGGFVPVEITAGAIEWGGSEAAQVLVRDITGRKLAEAALKQRNAQLQDLAVRLANAQESEREHLARELHDRIGQSLTAIALNMNIIDQSLAGDAPAALRNRLQDSLQLLEETVRQVRTVMTELRPPMLDDYGLLAALRWQLEQFSNRTGIRSRLEGDDSAVRPPLAVEMAQFRICQEALTNIVKHAGATEVVVSVENGPEYSRVIIDDDGKGFDPRKQVNLTETGHWGLLTMHERARAVGGTVTIDAAPGAGVRVIAEIPVLQENRPAATEAI